MTGQILASAAKEYRGTNAFSAPGITGVTCQNSMRSTTSPPPDYGLTCEQEIAILKQ